MKHRSIAIVAALFALLAALAPPLGADDVAFSAYAGGSSSIQVKAATENLRFCGFAAKETAAASASVTFYAGTSAVQANELYPISLGASESRGSGPWAICIPAAGGIYMTRSGSAEVVVFWRVAYSSQN